MRIEEAKALLGLYGDLTEERVRKAYGEVVRADHPDHGGSACLRPAKLKAARDMLLRQVAAAACVTTCQRCNGNGYRQSSVP